jgi:hypothetical protein
VSGVDCIIRYTAWKFHSRQIFQSCISSFVICIIRARYFIRKKSRFVPAAAAAALENFENSHLWLRGGFFRASGADCRLPSSRFHLYDIKNGEQLFRIILA